MKQVESAQNADSTICRAVVNHRENDRNDPACNHGIDDTFDKVPKASNLRRGKQQESIVGCLVGRKDDDRDPAQYRNDRNRS